MKRFFGRPANRNRVITVRRAPGNQSRAILRFGPLVMQAAIGRSGITTRKREGDGATPLAAMRLLYGFVRAERRRVPPCRLELRRIPPDLKWCDAPAHGAYNRPLRTDLAASHETMRRDDGLYDICIVLDWNVTARKRNCGSAIFFHLIRPGYQPTQGCIALSVADMKRLLPFLRKGMVMRVT